MLERKITCENCGEDYPPSWPHSCTDLAESNSPSDLITLLASLKSLTARSAISSAMAQLEEKIAKHESGEWHLCDEALADYLHDRKLLRDLGAG